MYSSFGPNSSHMALSVFFGVRLATIARFFVKVPDGWPTTSTRALVRAMDLPNLILRKRHVSKNNISIAVEVFNNFIPAGCLFDSSASALGGDPTYEHRLAFVHVLLHKCVCVFRRKLGGSVKVAI